MALDLRLQQKMTQQLVMTPQLQQAIKLLQLSHLEMADVLRDEMEQNPVLEEHGDGDGEGPAEASLFERGGEGMEDMPMDVSPAEATAASEARYEASESESGDGGMDTNYASEAPVDATPEPTGSEVEREIDWESYLDAHSYSLPATGSNGGDSGELPSFEATLTKPTSLIEHLRWQVQMAGLSAEATAIAMFLIEEINEDGYLTPDALQNVAEELGVPVAAVEEVLTDVQEFDPQGVAARNLRECLLLQARHLSAEDPLVYDIIDRHLHNVERRNLPAIAKDLKATVEAVSGAIKAITQLEPRPGRLYTDREPQYISPDIYVSKIGGGESSANGAAPEAGDISDYVIHLNEDGLPRLRISNYYRDAMQGAGGQTKSYIQEKLRSAAWLIRSIHMRQRTIYKVMESILKFQRDFFDKGVAHLKPLILKEVAEDVGMHESTISRVTTNKYVHTPQGIYELKFFFNSSIHCVDGESIASESVRNHIERLIAEENPKAPYSDQRIVEILKGRDIDIARRTVAKYREMLKIPSSSKRKRVF